MKLILDATCGGKMFWRNKDNPSVVYMDNRIVKKGVFKNNWNPNWCVNPCVLGDFRNMPFRNNTFKMVVFDPPHLISGSMKSVINIKYGLLNRNSWKQDILSGMLECYRVLDLYGTLIFKWCDVNLKAKTILDDFGIEPLFGDFTGKTGKTRWITFMKMSNHQIQPTQKAVRLI